MNRTTHVFSAEMESPRPASSSSTIEDEEDIRIDVEADDEEEEEMLSPRTESSATMAECTTDDSRHETDDDYYKPLKRLRMSHEPVRNKPLTPFSISDILNFPVDRGIVRPWDDTHRNNRRPRSADDDSQSEKSDSDSPDSPQNTHTNGQNSSPLDALFKMTNKAFEGLHSGENPAGKHLCILNSKKCS